MSILYGGSLLRHLLGTIKNAVLIAKIVQNDHGAVLILSCLGLVSAGIEIIFLALNFSHQVNLKALRVAIVLQEIINSGLMIKWSLTTTVTEEDKSAAMSLRTYGIASSVILLLQYMVFSIFIPLALLVASSGETSRMSEPTDLIKPEFTKKVTHLY